LPSLYPRPDRDGRRRRDGERSRSQQARAGAQSTYILLGALLSITILAAAAAGSARPDTVLLFSLADGYAPLVCAVGGQLRRGDACLPLIRPGAEARTLDGERLTLGRTAVFAGGDQRPRRVRGFTLPPRPAGADAAERQARVTPLERSARFAVWPADADPGLTAVPIGPPLEREDTAVLERLLRAPPPRPAAADQRRFMLIQHVPLTDGARAVSYGDRSGTPVLAVKRGERRRWTVVATGGPLCQSLSLLASFDLDGDGRRELILLRDNHNGAGIEVRSADLTRTLFSFDQGSL
jgi:hypothetical protein